MRSRNNNRQNELTQRDEVSEKLLGGTLPFKTSSAMHPYQVIDLFNVCFEHILKSPNLQEHIQQVKGDLYRRDYLAAFDNDDKRFAYASRWTPSRALAYSSLFSSLEPVNKLLGDEHAKINVLCVGGGAGSELVGLGSVFSRLKEFHPNSDSCMNVEIVDIADWGKVTTNVASYMKSNWVHQNECLNSKFLCADILATNLELIGIANMDLVTLMFTTNELFSEKRKDTVKFLLALNQNCKPGSLLLIAESAGSFLNIKIGERQFPVQFLIDTILVGKPGDSGDNTGAWDIISQSESIWYRIMEREVTYELNLENMRFFYRLYRKKKELE